MNTVSILQTRPDYIATKTFEHTSDGRIKETPYRSGTFLRHTPYEVASIDDLFDLLQVLEDDARAMLIRGQIKPAFVDRDEVTRTLLDVPAKFQVAMFEEPADGLNWMMCDFDDIALPVGCTPEQGIEMLVRTLPIEFHEVSYCYQFSSSAGVTGVKWNEEPDAAVEHYQGWSKISAHVFFWLKHKTRSLAQWAKNLNAARGTKVIDPAALEIVQPNYTARPKFIGMDDPLGSARSGF